MSATRTTDVGTCDVCDVTYNTASSLDHCAEEGVCWTHCATLSHRAEELR